MDYVDWVHKVASAVINRWSESDYERRIIGIGIHDLIDELGFDVDTRASDFIESKLSEALRDALRDLEALGLLDSKGGYYKLTNRGSKLSIASLSTDWPQIMEVYVEPNQLEFLSNVAEIGQEVYEQYVCVKDLNADQVFDALGWEHDAAKALFIAQRLTETGMLRHRSYMGGLVEVIPTYSGIVRVTREAETEVGRLIQGLLDEWETTNVDFKRELNLDREPQKGEFIRDVLGLATTKSSGKRFLVIGFSNDTREFHSSVDDRVTQERMEQILNAYCNPVPDIKFQRAPWASGQVGLIEMKRDITKIPYRVAKPIWKLSPGDVFVRHGSHTEPPTPQELQDLIEEGQQARGTGT